jgi:hypothetical protein
MHIFCQNKGKGNLRIAVGSVREGKIKEAGKNYTVKDLHKLYTSPILG